MKDKLKILRCGDIRFWAYYWISQEHSIYTMYDMQYARHNEVNLDGVDILYIHSPDITNRHAQSLPLEAKERGIKVIGAYAGNPHYWSPAEQRTYSFADLIVTISPQTYSFAKFHYTNIPVIYLPESVDTNFFTPKHCNFNRFNVGWAGGIHKKIKRFKIANQLNYPIYLKDDWKKQRDSQSKLLTLEDMKEYYRNIDVLLVTSESECQPRTVIEAMATGKPVISTDVGSISMLLDPEWIVPVHPEEKVIEEINKRLFLLKKYPMLRKAVGDRNLKFIEKYFSWNANAPLWDDIFKHVYNGEVDKAVYESRKFLFPFKKEFVKKFMKFDYSETNNDLIDIPKITKIKANEIMNRKFIRINNTGKTRPISYQRITTQDLLNELNTKCDYFLCKTSCKDAILTGQFDGDILCLGVKSEEELKVLHNVLKSSRIYHTIKENIMINISIDYYVKKTKIAIFENISVNVPLPVLPYLEKTFGKGWENE